MQQQPWQNNKNKRSQVIQQRITKYTSMQKSSHLIKVPKIIGHNVGQKASAIVLGRKSKVSENAFFQNSYIGTVK